MKKIAAQFVDLCRPFWRGKQGLLALLLLVAAISMGWTIVYLNVLLNDWSKTFYDALGTFDSSLLLSLMKEYGIYILIYIVVFVHQDWFTRWLIIRWTNCPACSPAWGFTSTRRSTPACSMR